MAGYGFNPIYGSGYASTQLSSNIYQLLRQTTLIFTTLHDLTLRFAFPVGQAALLKSDTLFNP